MVKVFGSSRSINGRTSETVAPGLPPGLLTPDLFAGALGVTNLTAAMANFPTV